MDFEQFAFNKESHNRKECQRMVRDHFDPSAALAKRVGPEETDGASRRARKVERRSR